MPDDEQVYLPQLMAFLCDIPVALGKVRYTATLIIGRYAFWLVKRPHILEPLLTYVTQGLGDRQVLPLPRSVWLVLVCVR